MAMPSAFCSGFAKTSVPEFTGTELLPLWEIPVGGATRAIEQGHWDRICVIRQGDLSLACADDAVWVDSRDRAQTLFRFGSRWMDVKSGAHHSCAVSESGELYCWAFDASTPFSDFDFGQVGVTSPSVGVLHRVCLPPP